MANEIISKLTKGFKFRINKKKKNNWKTLNSNESLPPTPTDEEYMVFSDTEAELYKAKTNITSNLSFSFSNTNSNNTTENNMHTKNILSGINNNTATYSSNVIGRSKTYNNCSTYNNRPTVGAPQAQNKYLYTPNTITESRKNSFQTVCPPQNVNSTQPITIQYTTSSNNSTPYSSVPNSPISFDSSDTCVNELKANYNNPFLTNTKPKVNNFLNVSTANSDPALSHSLISPIEFDGAGNEIKKSTTTTTTTNVNVTVIPQNTNTTTSTTTTNNNNSESQPVRNKTVKRVKPLITFDSPPVVSPMTAADSDSDEYIRGRKRSSKKHKKYTKKYTSKKLTLKTNDLKEMTKLKVSSEPTSAIAARAQLRLNSPNSVSNEEDDDVPLGIIQYKCISSILKETDPINISSLQSNTKKSHKSKNNYGYMSPPHEHFLEKYDPPKYNNYNNYYQENYVI